MVAVPAATPETIPVEEPMPAVPDALLDQVPVEVASVSVMVEPTQTVDEPAMAATVELFTVTIAVTVPQDVV